MARRAFCAEERFAGPRVADDDARRLETRLVVAGSPERVRERGDVGDLIVGECERRHAGPAGAHDRRHQLTCLIVEDDTRAQQARSAVAAARVGAVAKLAVDAVERLATFHRRGIGGWTVRIVAALRYENAATPENEERKGREEREAGISMAGFA